MKPFRLKDPVTGLYYCPSREVTTKAPDGKKIWVKSNLSKKGKVYFKNYENGERSIRDHTQLEKSVNWGSYKGWKPVCRCVKFEVEYL